MAEIIKTQLNENNETNKITNSTAYSIKFKDINELNTINDAIPWNRYYALLFIEFICSLLYTLFCILNFVIKLRFF